MLEFIFLGVLDFGIWGAALATCTGMLVCVLIAFVPFLRRKALLRFTRPRFSPAMIKQIVSCGSPNFLNNIAGRITSIVMNAILVRLGGETAVSVYGILMFADGFIQPLLYGMCDSLQPNVGYNWGARQFSRVRAIERCCFTASGIVSLASAALVALIPELITRLFVANPTPEVMEMSVGALRVFSLTYITRWFSFATQSYMLAVGKPLSASLISVSTALVFPMLLVAALWPLGLTGIWLNFPGTSLLAESWPSSSSGASARPSTARTRASPSLRRAEAESTSLKTYLPLTSRRPGSRLCRTGVMTPVKSVNRDGGFYVQGGGVPQTQRH